MLAFAATRACRAGEISPCTEFPQISNCRSTRHCCAPSIREMKNQHARYRRSTRSALTASAILVGLLGVGLATTETSPADAATTGAGYSGITPWGGYLGNYIAPDGSRVYCMDSAADWPSGATSGGTLVYSMSTEWGGALSAITLKRLNYALLKWGQTADPTLAAALDAYIYSYTSTGALHYGAGYSTGATYIDGNSAVLPVYNAIWGEVESWLPPAQGVATLAIQMHDSYNGTIIVNASPADATGTLVLTGAVFTSSGLNTASVVNGSVIAIHGTPVDTATNYSITANASFTAAGGPDANVIIYTTGGQQRTIRGGTSSPVSFNAASFATDPLPLVFEPIVSTQASQFVEGGEAFMDSVTAAVAPGSASWRTRLGGAFYSITTVGTLYGPFTERPTLASEVPLGATVVGSETITMVGPGEYTTSGDIRAGEGGFYTWVWRIDATEQSAQSQTGLPDDYRFVDEFGSADETSVVPMSVSAVSSVPSNVVALGSVLEDRLTISLDSGSWLTEGDVQLPVTFIGTAYFISGDVAPVESDVLPAEAIAIGTSTIVASGPGSYSTHTPALAPTARTGFVTWVWRLSDSTPYARYFRPWTDHFGVPAETSRVELPTIETIAVPESAIGEAAHDTAIVSGVTPASETFLVFQAYLQAGGEPATCDSSTLVFDSSASSIPIIGAGTYASPDATLPAFGTYFWVESLVTADNEVIHRGICGAANEITVVSPPQVATTATDEVTLGSSAHDTATVSGLVPTGAQIVFNAYRQSGSGPSCTASNLVFSTTDRPSELRGPGDYESEGVTFDQLGTYLWIATVIDRVGTTITAGECGAPSEQTIVQPRTLASTGLDRSRLAPLGGFALLSITMVAAGLVARSLRRGRCVA